VSADRWDTCPRCYNESMADRKVRVQSHADSYGKVTPEEWLLEGESLAKESTDPEDNKYMTFREDFEWYIVSGTLHGVFKGHCTKCGLGIDYKIDPIIFYDERNGEAV